MGVFDKAVSSGLSKFVFKLLMPVMLFQMMSHLSEMPPVDWRVLIAFFGSCIVVFTLGRQLGKRVFHQDSTGQVITGMGGIFGNNVQLGVPIVQVSLGNAAIPTISLIIIFNVLLLWTAATACVEFGRTGGHVDTKKFVRALLKARVHAANVFPRLPERVVVRADYKKLAVYILHLYHLVFGMLSCFF